MPARPPAAPAAAGRDASVAATVSGSARPARVSSPTDGLLLPPAKHPQDRRHHALRPGAAAELFELAGVEPRPVAGEAAVHGNAPDLDLPQLHAALRAAHVMLLPQLVALLLVEALLLLRRKLAQLLRVLAREVLLFRVGRLGQGAASNVRWPASPSRPASPSAPRRRSGRPPGRS